MQFDTDAPAADLSSKPYRRAAARAPEFPGCRPIPLKREALDDYDRPLRVLGRGYRDRMGGARAHVRHPRAAFRTPGGPEPRHRGVRGSPIECYGTMDLLLRDARGEKRRIMQADQSVYLHPWRARLPTDAMEIGVQDYPDVVLEVDHTTDVRRGKLCCTRRGGSPRSGWTCRRRAMR